MSAPAVPQPTPAALRERAEILTVRCAAFVQGSDRYSPHQIIHEAWDVVDALLAAARRGAGDTEQDADLDMSNCREVICRAFDDWDPVWEAWLAWYQPSQWLHIYRALGAFLSIQLLPIRSRRVGHERDTARLEFMMRQSEHLVLAANGVPRVVTEITRESIDAAIAARAAHPEGPQHG